MVSTSQIFFLSVLLFGLSTVGSSGAEGVRMKQSYMCRGGTAFTVLFRNFVGLTALSFGSTTAERV